MLPVRSPRVEKLPVLNLETRAAAGSLVFQGSKGCLQFDFSASVTRDLAQEQKAEWHSGVAVLDSALPSAIQSKRIARWPFLELPSRAFRILPWSIHYFFCPLSHNNEFTGSGPTGTRSGGTPHWASFVDNTDSSLFRRLLIFSLILGEQCLV